jgi:hypothetical protein
MSIQTLTKEKTDWAKMRVKNAEYAHISKETIRVTFQKRDKNWIKTEWVEEYPNDGMIKLSPRISDKTIYVANSIVALIKKFGHIESYEEQSPTDYFKELGITSQCVSIHLNDMKTYFSDSAYFKDGKCIASGSTIRVMGG